MIDCFILWRLARFERQFTYDIGYARALLATSRRAFFRYASLTRVAAHREEAPPLAWHAVKLVAAAHEDCGPCLQLVVDMALADGVDHGVLRGILQGDEASMGPDATLGRAYAMAAIARTDDLAELQRRVEQRWGAKALADLALAFVGARAIPMLKYALGQGRQCQQVRLGNDVVVPPPALTRTLPLHPAAPARHAP